LTGSLFSGTRNLERVCQPGPVVPHPWPPTELEAHAMQPIPIQ
jgi:hypothetical protein